MVTNVAPVSVGRSSSLLRGPGRTWCIVTWVITCCIASVGVSGSVISSGAILSSFCAIRANFLSHVRSALCIGTTALRMILTCIAGVTTGFVRFSCHVTSRRRTWSFLPGSCCSCVAVAVACFMAARSSPSSSGSVISLVVTVVIVVAATTTVIVAIVSVDVTTRNGSWSCCALFRTWCCCNKKEFTLYLLCSRYSKRHSSSTLVAVTKSNFQMSFSLFRHLPTSI